MFLLLNNSNSKKVGSSLYDILEIIEIFLKAINTPPAYIPYISKTILTLLIIAVIFNYSNLLLQYVKRVYKNKVTAKDLHPFFSSIEVKNATKYYIPTNFQNVPPSQDEEPGRSYIAAARNPLIPLFLNKAFVDEKSDSKYYLVLADSGMGKTTFMINLYLSYKFKRGLFWQQPKHEIKLFPFAHPKTLERIKLMPVEEKENCILLLDAFDEDNEAVDNYKKRLQEVLELTIDFRRIVITCRTQFFPSSKYEPSETGKFKFGPNAGQHYFYKIYLSVFDEIDIKKYLKKRFKSFLSFKQSKFMKAYNIVLKSPNLMMRPMLLSRITDLTETNVELEYSFQIYETLIDKWLERESSKSGIVKKYGKDYKKLLFNFSRALAKHLYLNRNKGGSKFTLKVDEIIHNPSGLQLKDVEGNLIGIEKNDQGTRSLLNRNAVGEYKFSHKSILEYFLAYEVLHNKTFRSKFMFSNDLDAAKRFFLEMAKVNPSLVANCPNIRKLGLSTYELNNFTFKEKVDTPLAEKKSLLFEVSAKQFLTFTAFLIGIIVIAAGVMTIISKKNKPKVEENEWVEITGIILLIIWILVLIWKTIVFIKLRNQLIKESKEF